LARKIISNILAGRLEIGKRGRYYIDREVGQFPPPNEFLLCAISGHSQILFLEKFFSAKIEKSVFTNSVKVSLCSTFIYTPHLI